MVKSRTIDITLLILSVIELLYWCWSWQANPNKIRSFAEIYEALETPMWIIIDTITILVFIRLFRKSHYSKSLLVISLLVILATVVIILLQRQPIND